MPEPSFTNPEEQIREEIEKCVQDMGEKFYPRIAELLRSDEDDTECPNSCYVPETLSDDLIDGFKDSLMGALSNRDLPETCPDSCYTHLGKYWFYTDSVINKWVLESFESTRQHPSDNDDSEEPFDRSEDISPEDRSDDDDPDDGDARDGDSDEGLFDFDEEDPNEKFDVSNYPELSGDADSKDDSEDPFTSEPNEFEFTSAPDAKSDEDDNGNENSVELMSRLMGIWCVVIQIKVVYLFLVFRWIPPR